MNRRQFLQALMSAPLLHSVSGLSAVHALPAQLQFQRVNPFRIPRVLLIFLNGGASELAGNLSNVEQLRQIRDHGYPEQFADQRTPNSFWRDAGGDVMERLLYNKQLSVFRSCYRSQDDNRTHGLSVRQVLAGNYVHTAQGIASRLGQVLVQQNPFTDADLNELNLPFVSLDGVDAAFDGFSQLGLSANLSPVSLVSSSNHPYRRESLLPSVSEYENALVSVARSRRYQLPQYMQLAQLMDRRDEVLNFYEAELAPDKVEARLNLYNAHLAPDRQIAYGNDYFAQQLKSAINLFISNPQTLFVNMGNGIGHWDDHSQALLNYPQRMQKLFLALEQASRHIEAAKAHNVNHAGNIVIWVVSEFGRNVLLNSASGWDHGNNQTVYLLGGSNLYGQALGQVQGETQLVEESTRRVYTRPLDSSFSFDPAAIAASIYRGFGVQNPQLLTDGIDALPFV